MIILIILVIINKMFECEVTITVTKRYCYYAFDISSRSRSDTVEFFISNTSDFLWWDRLNN